MLEALKAVVFLSLDIQPPVWLEEPYIQENEIIACKNGLLYPPRQLLVDHTPTFFGYEGLDFKYDPEAPDPKQWLNFFGQLWPDDPAPQGHFD